MRTDLHEPAHVVEHPAQRVVVRVLHPHPRVGHVAGRRGLGRLLLGSTAAGVLHGAPCNVLTVRIDDE